MSWLIVALVGPVLWAVSTHMDKYLVERYFKSRDVGVLLVFTALIGIVLLPFIAFYVPSFAALSFTSILVIASTGLLYMAAMYFYLQALQSNEASVVAPFYQATPILAAALAYAVLHEVLSGKQILGGGLIVAGTALASFGFGAGKSKINLRLIVLMLLCATALAISSVVFKLFAIREDFWPTTFWTYAGEAVFGILILAIPSQRQVLRSLLHANPGPVLAINGANELINLGGSLIARYALLLAPLGLVQAVSSTTTIFVFLFGIILTVVFPKIAQEDLSVRSLLQKAAAVTLVTLGVIRLGQG
jgi:drug/metabolite transporter (DMT)-like permease